MNERDCADLLARAAAYSHPESLPHELCQEISRHLERCEACRESALAVFDELLFDSIDDNEAAEFDVAGSWKEVERLTGASVKPAPSDRFSSETTHQSSRRLTRRALAGITALAACVAAVMFAWQLGPFAGGLTLELAQLRDSDGNIVAFPEDDTAFTRGDSITLELRGAQGKYRYVVLFDNRGRVQIRDKAALDRDNWSWNIKGTGMETAIFLATAEPLGDTAFLRARLRSRVGRQSLDPGKRIIWSSRDGIRTMGDAPTEKWVRDVHDILRSLPGAEFHGCSLPTEKPER